MGLSWMQIAIVAALVVLLFGRGKIASVMGEIAQGIKNFRKGLDEKDANILEADEIGTDEIGADEINDKKQDNNRTK